MTAPSPSLPAFRQSTLLSPPPERADSPPSIWQRLLPATHSDLLALGRLRDYRAGDLLFRQGDAHNGIHLIEVGSIKSFYVSEDGRELTLGFWTAGHYVGAPQMFGGSQHAWSSVAVAQTRCLWLPGPELRELARQRSDLALALIDALIHKSQCYCALLQLLATHSMRVRLARLLAMLAARETDRAVVIRLSHGELASMIGSTRQWVSQSLSHFACEGMLERLADGGYSVLDERALRNLH